ncbi:MAG: hypothetical protein HGA44_10915, partial [Cellulomonadaceae bacterium]|nr:hypothetical protein [Cellulomonadaceae bacterium]
ESARLSLDVAAWLRQQTVALDAHLAERSPSGRVRHGAAHRVIGQLPALPVLDVATVAESQAVTDNAARSALETLAESGVVRRDRKADRTRTLYVATGLLDLISATSSGQRSGSSIDPHDPVLTLDGSAVPEGACGHWMPRVARPCRLPVGHHGQHR